MRQYANIGKATIIQAVGVASNYKKRICCQEDCKEYAHLGEAACKSCPFLSKKVEYINEKNRYGSKASLPLSALKLLLYVHMQNIEQGLCWIDTKEAVQLLNCCEKTIWASLERLESDGYISFSKKMPHIAGVYINDYDQMYLSGAKGGRGYYTLTLPVFKYLAHIENIVKLRVVLRELLNLDEDRFKGQLSGAYVKMNDIRRYLPKYCKPNVVLAELAKSPSDFMTFDYEKKDGIIHLQIPDKYKSSITRDGLKESFRDDFRRFIFEFNTHITSVNSQVDIKDADFFKIIFENNGIDITNVERVRAFILPSDILDNLAGMALMYGFDTVKKAMCTYYVTYVWKNKEHTIQSPGAVIHTIIKAQLSNSINK